MFIFSLFTFVQHSLYRQIIRGSNHLKSYRILWVLIIEVQLTPVKKAACFWQTARILTIN